MSSTATLDLSQPFPKAANYNANTASCVLDGQFAHKIRGYALLHGGKLIAQDYKEGYSSSSRFVQWSVTKSWTSALIGCLVDEGALSLSQTLEDIFNVSMGAAEWAQVENREDKRLVKLKELLTMESGLVDPSDGRTQGSLVEVLNHGVYRPGYFPQFSYLSSTHILAYIVRAAAGESPQAYAQSDRCPIWSSLGLSETADVSWDVNNEGVATSAFGLRLTVPAMLKLGALYLQANPNPNPNPSPSPNPSPNINILEVVWRKGCANATFHRSTR